MTIKASAALIFAAALLMGFAGSLPAAAADGDNAVATKSESTTSDKSVRHGSRHLKKHDSDRKSARAAAKSDESRKADENLVADATGSTPAALPSWAANANAQMTAADAPPDSAKGMSAAMSEKANSVLQATTDKPAETETPAEPGAVAGDQPNALDRSLTPSDQPANATTQPAAATTQGVVLASTSRPSSEQAASNDSSTLDKTSMIGKIFIAVGALLTVASAARMFMA
jgi:hypothetical protein